MAQLILPADVEQAIIDELAPHFSISTSIPETKPSVFIRVVTTGGTQRDLVTDTPLVTIEAFAKRESAARNAANEAVARLQLAGRQNKLGSEVCYGVGMVALPQNFPLPSVPTHIRYIATIAPDIRRRVTTL